MINVCQLFVVAQHSCSFFSSSEAAADTGQCRHCPSSPPSGGGRSIWLLVRPERPGHRRRHKRRTRVVETGRLPPPQQLSSPRARPPPERRLLSQPPIGVCRVCPIWLPAGYLRCWLPPPPRRCRRCRRRCCRRRRRHPRVDRGGGGSAPPPTGHGRRPWPLPTALPLPCTLNPSVELPRVFDGQHVRLPRRLVLH